MQRAEQAVVIGGSMAGLWTARVLADHFEHVTIIERDQLPDGAQSRPGVPQDKHVHVLLARGLQIMTQLFPGIEQDFQTAGAVQVNLNRDVRSKVRGRWLPRFVGPYETYACSRVLLESILRRRVRALPNVTFCDGVQATGLIADGTKVTGVQLHHKQTAQDSSQAAAFVVDASGRGTKVPEWLTALGFAPPAETVIDAKVGYAGRRYRKPADYADWHILAIGAEPPSKSRQALIYEEEQGIWMVMLAGVMGDYPPVEEEDFLAFAQSIDPELAAAIKAAEPISAIFGYRRTENRRRLYEDLARWPERLIVVGDAACGFNPIYGQGMTVAALTAVALGEALAQAATLDGLAVRFQRQIPKLVAPAWLLATGADFEWIGRPPSANPLTRFTGWYLPQVLAALPQDRAVHRAFSAVQHLIKGPESLFAPHIVAHVLYRSWRNRLT